MPEFSVIVPTFNRHEFVTEAVRSVLRQTVQDFEVIVVNDGGESPPLPDDSRVRLVEQANQGPAAGRNHGIRVSEGRYLTFLDDDDLFTPERLRIAQTGLAVHPITACSKGYGTPASVELKMFLKGSGFHAGQFAIAREICPPFDERIRGSEDLEWVIRLIPQGIETVDEVGYLMNKHEGVHLTSNLRALVESREIMYDVQRDYFKAHPDLLSYEWRKIGAYALLGKDTALARRAFWRSLRIRPTLKGLVWLARSFGRGDVDAKLSAGDLRE